MKALLIVLDSVGVGHAPDAAAYGDQGANTLTHIYGAVPSLKLPHLDALGLDHVRASPSDHSTPRPKPAAACARMTEASAGKDTTTGHWEIAGVVTEDPFLVIESFPRELVEAVEHAAGVSFLGNEVASGTVIIEDLGALHLETGNPILYTSADSVLQIATHEEIVPLDRLYEICQIARSICDEQNLRIARVIARPFIGKPGSFTRTPNRRDFSLIPPPTILNRLEENGTRVVSIGKISDIFAGSGITESHPTKSNAEGMGTIERLWDRPELDGALFFANLVDFDMLYGHRRDPKGYAQALASFDHWLGGFLPRIHDDDLLIITADHGNDPTWTGTDHTREQVPLLACGKPAPGLLSTRESFTDVAATLADFFDIDPWPIGKSILS